ncbi:hypothetical protein Btru_056697 [Bulinus truncatus]|nr:hypothetical protein Btru_056697 [Bulinus truncatus]
MAWLCYISIQNHCHVLVLYELRQTFGLTDRDDMTFVMHFGSIFPCLVLLLTGPGTHNFAGVHLYRRYKDDSHEAKNLLSSGINYAVDILAYAVLVHLFWPDRTILFIVEGERPLPTYDLEITGLLDDNQEETTVFSRQGLELTDFPTQPKRKEPPYMGKKSTKNGRGGVSNGGMFIHGNLQFHQHKQSDEDAVDKDS